MSTQLTATATVCGKTVWSSGGKLEVKGTMVKLNGEMVSQGTVQGKGSAETRDLAAFTRVELRTIANVGNQGRRETWVRHHGVENLL